MTAFRIAGFSGLVPRLAKQLLAPNQAQVATNCNLTSGDLRPRNGLRLVFSPVIDSDIASMFRIEKDGNEKWLAWTRDVDVARSPIAGNTDKRFYYTGDGEPRVSDYDTAAAGPGLLSCCLPCAGSHSTSYLAYCFTFGRDGSRCKPGVLLYLCHSMGRGVRAFSGLGCHDWQG